MIEKALVFPRKDGGHFRVVDRSCRVEYPNGRPEAVRAVTRVYTGPRKALRV